MTSLENHHGGFFIPEEADAFTDPLFRMFARDSCPLLRREGRGERKRLLLSTAMLNCVGIGLHCDITMLNCDIIIIVPLRSQCIIMTF